MSKNLKGLWWNTKNKHPMFGKKLSNEHKLKISLGNKGKQRFKKEKVKIIKGSPEYIEFRRKMNEANRRYYSKPEIKLKKKLYKKGYEKRNREKINKRNRERYKRFKKIGLLWRQRFPEKVKSYTQTEKYKKMKKIKDREYNKKNREKVNLKHKIWRDKNRKIVRKYNQKYYTSPKGIINYTKHNHRRIALIKQRPFDLSKENIIKIFERDKVCVYCGSNINLELDHIIPLKLEGNSLFNNFVLSCKKCNTSKSGREVFEWCKLMNREVPKIVLELLEKQKALTTLN